MTGNPFASLGMYGGAGLASFAFGIVPFNPDIPLVAISETLVDSPVQLPLLVVIATLAHVAAKVITYYMGIGLLKLPRGRWKAVIEKAQARLDRWGKWPKVIVFVASAVGLPPLYLVGFVAHAMRVRIVPFIVLVTLGRLIHFGVVMALPWVTY
jgi:membrane protein YqaA with SNARE-associated domain